MSFSLDYSWEILRLWEDWFRDLLLITMTPKWCTMCHIATAQVRPFHFCVKCKYTACFITCHSHHEYLWRMEESMVPVNGKTALSQIKDFFIGCISFLDLSWIYYQSISQSSIIMKMRGEKSLCSLYLSFI